MKISLCLIDLSVARCIKSAIIIVNKFFLTLKSNKMKPLRLNTLLKNILLCVFAIMIVLSFESCTKKVDFLLSSVVPAARGYVKVNRDKNKNYVININLSNLAEVQRVQPLKLTYIVWMIADDGTTKNLGRINSKTSLFSKKLKASFKSVSTFKPTKIFITAEDNPSIQYPGEQVLLTTDRF
jgi:hypothetical protein